VHQGFFKAVVVEDGPIDKATDGRIAADDFFSFGLFELRLVVVLFIRV
jgi:hypothetical protein